MLENPHRELITIVKKLTFLHFLISLCHMSYWLKRWYTNEQCLCMHGVFYGMSFLYLSYSLGPTGLSTADVFLVQIASPQSISVTIIQESADCLQSVGWDHRYPSPKVCPDANLKQQLEYSGKCIFGLNNRPLSAPTLV